MYATRLVTAGVATAIVCTYCSGSTAPPTRPVLTTAVVDAAEIVQEPSTIGIADSDLYGMSQADVDETLDKLQSIGVQNVRIFVPWAFVEPSQGVYDWSYLDQVVDAATARNMGVLAEVGATPVWDAPSGTIPGAGTPNPTDYASFLTQVAKRYGTDISSYEIWNEPNYVASYDPIDPATYTALLKAAYPAIKAVDPSATVVAGAVGSVVSFGDVTLDPVTFVQDMLADGAAGFFDALSLHPYQESLEFSQGSTIPNSPINQLNAIGQLLAANGLGGDKVWLTEYGLPTADVSQQTQATYIQDLLDAWQNVSYAGPVFVYTAQDGTSTDPSGTYGIYESDWTPKLAVAVIQAEIAKFATAVVTNPVVSAVQQMANAFAQAMQALAQQIAKALAQAFANAVAFLGMAPAVTPALKTTAQTATTTNEDQTAPAHLGATHAPLAKSTTATDLAPIVAPTRAAVTATSAAPSPDAKPIDTKPADAKPTLDPGTHDASEPSHHTPDHPSTPRTARGAHLHSEATA